MRKKKLFRILIAVTCMSSLIVMPVSATGLEERKAAKQSEVNSLQSELTNLMTEMGNLEMKLLQKSEEITKAELDLEDAKAKETAQYEAMKLRIRYMYEDGNIAMIDKVLTSGSFAEMVAQASYAGSIHQYDRQALSEYQQTQVQIIDLKTTLETDMASLKEMESDLQSQQETLDATITSKQSEVANLDQQIQAAREAAARNVQAQQAAENGGNITITAGTSASTNNQGASNAGNQNSTVNNDDTNTTASTPSTPSAPPASVPEEPPVVSTPVETPSNDSGSAYSSQREAILSVAWSQIGVPYRYGGSTPYVGLDCSGLVQYCYRQAGIWIGRTDTDQRYGGRVTTNPKPGDICWKPGHVGIYIGDGQMIEAQQTGTNIMVSNVRVKEYVTYLD